MSKRVFKAGLRFCLGDKANNNTLEILQDDNRIYLVIQENTDGPKALNARSQAVCIENPRGDSRQMETYAIIQSLIKHIHEMHEKYPEHPAYIVEK